MNTNKKYERKPNPRSNANPLSALLFTYMVPVFIRNYKKGLKEEDLYQVLQEDKADSLGDCLQISWKNEIKKNRSLPLHRCFLKLHGCELFLYGIFNCLNELSLVILLPLATGGFVSYFENRDVTENDLYMYSGLLIITIIVDAILTHSVTMGLMHLSLKMLTASCSLIYRKTLTLTQLELGKATTGHIIDLLSRDIGTFEDGFLLIHHIWIMPLKICIGTYLLYNILGVSAFSGITLLVVFIPIQVYFGQIKTKLYLKRSLKTDERLGLLTEILNGIKVIKMYAWERPFGNLISFARRSEIKVLRNIITIDAISFSLEIIIPGFATFISIVVYISLGNTINAEKIYSVLIIYDAIRPSISMFADAMSNAAEVHTALIRMEAYLRKEDVNYKKSNDVFNSADNIHNSNEKVPDNFSKISLSKVSCQWNIEFPEATLSNIDLELVNNQLIAIIGPVGCGKSSLFNVFLQELAISKGKMDIIGNISYASQEPWLFASSIRQNILFGNSYDEERYKAVIDVCGLQSDLDMFPEGDKTLVGEKGKIISGGQKARIGLARCVYKQADIYLLDDPLSAVDSKVGKHLFQKCITEFLNNKMCVLITHQLQYLKDADKIIILDEGKIVAQGNYDDLKDCDLLFAKILQQFETEKENNQKDSTILKPTNNLALPEDDRLDGEDSTVDEIEEYVHSGNIKSSIYVDYIKYGGSCFVIIAVLILFLLSQGINNFEDYFISFWINLEQQYTEIDKNNATSNGTMDRENVIIIYTVLIVASSIVAFIKSMAFYALFLQASVKIHNEIFAKLSYGTMHFFNKNPTGRILNRFSEDLGEIDNFIPGVLGDVIQIGLQFVGTIILTSIINPWLLLPAMGLIVAFYLLRGIYLETSRSVKRIEAVTRSSIFSHMTATLQGLSTIRACNAQQILVEEFDKYQDIHSSAWLLFITSSSAFTMFLDLVCAVVVTIIIIIIILFREDYYSGDAGLILTQYLLLTGIVQWGMHQWSELENHMTSVERLFEYKAVPNEPVRKAPSNLPKNWLQDGNIEFKNVSMKYNVDDSYVLNKLTFHIRSNEKIGVVGRTGAGKSSIVAALFQLYDIDGSIIMDNIDITTLPLESLRENISIIPQDPVLFSGTIRKNLDPFEIYNDELLWNSLAQVELKCLIEEMPLGLQSGVAENGSNFSVGQRQLICLARAILRKNKILVMDEATANVDPQTDEFIQNTIKQQFKNCSVITIAHRLHTIIDSDRIIVVESGKLVEFDHPHILLQNNNGYFYSMVKAAGNKTLNHLEELAKKSFTKFKNT